MKDKKIMILVIVIVLLLFGLSYIKSKAPKAIDWAPTFINTKTDPYGTYISYQLLGDIFNKENIRTTRRPIYNNLKKDLENYFSYQDESYGSSEYDYNDIYKEYEEYNEEKEYSEAPDSLLVEESEVVKADNYINPASIYQDFDNIVDTTSYIFINTEFSLDKVDLQYLLDFVGLGNNVFISAESFSSNLMDTLRIKSKIGYFSSDSIYTLVDYSSKKYRFGSIAGQTRLNTDSCRLPVRPLSFSNKQDTVFVDVQYGKGHFFIHTIPSAFANVNLLQTDKYDFAFRCLSYLPQNSKVIWDEYQKQGDIGERSMFKVMLDNTPLRIALYLILAGLLLFMIFRAKRIQRIIPVIQPHVNSSLEFLDTISNLYYRKKDFGTIAEKRHTYFLDYIRKNYYMSTEKIDEEFVNVLSAKSGMEKDKLNELFTLYQEMVILPYISNDNFIKYNSLLEEFYRNVKNK